MVTDPARFLPKRWSDAAIERVVRWLQTPDDALEPLADDPTEEEYR